MPTPPVLDDAAAEAVLRGEAVSSELEPLAEAVEAIRGSASAHVEPSVELAERIASGDFSDVVPASQTRRTTFAERTRSVVAKAGTRIRVAVVVAAALFGVTGVAAAGALPDVVQDGMEGIIEYVTPVTFPDRPPADDVADEPEGDTGDSESGKDAENEKTEPEGHRPDERTGGDGKETGISKDNSEKGSTRGPEKQENKGRDSEKEKQPENPGNGSDNRPENPGEPADEHGNRPENPGGGAENRPDEPGKDAGESPQDRGAPGRGSGGGNGAGDGKAGGSDASHGGSKEQRSDNAPGPPAGKSGP
ncbi:hypothetical protein [Phytoactinopolyspora endophytica]|uniref:hypothetical protein n=1 Tax=Phytoactinopolyspora endophytica TaxID=1642495 RepID=UPI00101BA340|nr:hypothetical protein [Phytoactinopolyspora endophytica]